MSVNDWLTAFLLTQVIEAPLYWIAAHTLSAPKRATYAFGASTLTHPVIWFCLPWQTSPYVPLLIVAETFVITVEGLWGRLWNVPRYWKASMVANVASLCVGSMIRWLLLYPKLAE
ncbi:MAG: hypothetical protein U1F71_18075 [Verrucomicrobiaceae bacterium]